MVITDIAVIVGAVVLCVYYVVIIMIFKLCSSEVIKVINMRNYGNIFLVVNGIIGFYLAETLGHVGGFGILGIILVIVGLYRMICKI